MRTTQLYIDDNDMERLMRDSDPQKLWQAIGYLSQWGLGYPTCEITVADFENPELVAVYRREAPDAPRGEPAYVIAAVWHDDHFGFHS